MRSQYRADRALLRSRQHLRGELSAAALASVPTASLLNTMLGPPSATDPFQLPDTPLFGIQQFLLDAYRNGGTHVTTVTHSDAKGVHGSTNSICNAS
jgi:hypothetical protein